MIVDQRILIGYDMVNGGTVFWCYRGMIFVKDQDDRSTEVVEGLHKVSWELPELPQLETAESGVQLTVLFVKYTRACLYSDQAWTDLLEVGELQ